MTVPFSKIENKICVICQDDLDKTIAQNMVITSCGHNYHEECLTMSFNYQDDKEKKCAVCRKSSSNEESSRCSKHSSRIGTSF